MTFDVRARALNISALPIAVLVERDRRATAKASFAYDRAGDGPLMAKAADGDRRAFDEIIIRHGSFAFKVAFKILKDRTIAEDLAQEALVRAWNGARSFEASRAKFTTWLYRIVANLCIDHCRRREWERLPDAYDPVDPSMTALDLIEQGERRAALSGAIGTLSDRRRTAIAMVYEEGLSQAETARRMGVSEKAVERLIARAVSSLRGMLEAH